MKRRPLSSAQLDMRVRELVLAIPALEKGDRLPYFTARWLADGLKAFLVEGEPLEVALGLKAQRGSHTTPQKVFAALKPALIGDDRQSADGARD